VPLGDEPAQLCPADRLAEVQARIVRGTRQQHLINPFRLQLRVPAVGRLQELARHLTSHYPRGHGQRA
jgi:hypothetical protein